MTTDPSRKLPRSVWLLGGVSLFADLASEMVYPLLPLFVVAVLGASATDLGWIEGIAQAVVALLAAYAGIRSDRFRRRVPWVRWGYALPVVGKAILAGAFAWPMVLLGRTIDRIGKGIRSSPRDALIADATPAGARGRAFGLHRALDTAGALAGVIVAAVLLWWLGGSPSATGAQATPNEAWPYRIIFAITDHAPADRRGRALGIFHLATGVTTIASSVTAGLLWDHVSPSAPFWFGSGAAIVAIAFVPVAARISTRAAVQPTRIE